MVRKDIEVRNYLICWKSPYFVRLSTDFVQGKYGHVFLVLTNQVKLVLFLLISELFDFFTMRKLFELFLAQSFVKEPNVIVDDKRHSSKTDKLMNRCDFIIIIWMLELFTVILIVLFIVLHIVNPNLILLIDAQPSVHHRKKIYLYNG